jgi:hypothetical protein
MPPFDVVWWITAIEIPVLSALFWMIWRCRHDGATATEDLRRMLEIMRLQQREDLSAYKLEVAKTYASVAALNAVERRLTDHLLRIEAKLDLHNLETAD